MKFGLLNPWGCIHILTINRNFEISKRSVFFIKFQNIKRNKVKYFFVMNIYSRAYSQNIYTHKSYNLSCLYLPITINSFPFLSAWRGALEIAFFAVQTILLFGTQRWRQRWCLNNRRKHGKVGEEANKAKTRDPSTANYWSKSSM